MRLKEEETMQNLEQQLLQKKDESAHRKMQTNLLETDKKNLEAEIADLFRKI